MKKKGNANATQVARLSALAKRQPAASRNGNSAARVSTTTKRPRKRGSNPNGSKASKQGPVPIHYSALRRPEAPAKVDASYARDVLGVTQEDGVKFFDDPIPQAEVWSKESKSFGAGVVIAFVLIMIGILIGKVV